VAGRDRDAALEDPQIERADRGGVGEPVDELGDFPEDGFELVERQVGSTHQNVATTLHESRPMRYRGASRKGGSPFAP